MRRIARGLVAAILAILARGIVAKYKPLVVMVTGSVGKTSTKDAVKAALSERYYLRASEKSYNSEFGVPLTIIGAKNAWHSALGWLRVIGEALALLLLPNHYPKLLVLEVGADHPGDLRNILTIAKPDAVVVTRLPDVPVHVEAYESPDAIREEEFAPAYALPAGSPLIVSSRDTHAIAMAKKIDSTLITFGFLSSADVYVGEPKVVVEHGRPTGMEASVETRGKSYTLRAPDVVGRPQVLAPAAAFALALALGMTPEEALTGLKNYQTPPGRCRLLNGINGSILIDDSYNASPAAMEEAIEALKEVPAKRRIAVLGDMLELGRYSAQEHERIGALAAKEADIFIGVGTRARTMRDAALASGTREEYALAFDTGLEAIPALEALLQEEDVVLIKGSQNIRAERIVKALLANPEDASQLVRQEKEWMTR